MTVFRLSAQQQTEKRLRKVSSWGQDNEMFVRSIIS